ncbi:MAG: serine/threonine protein kinase, partial [Ruminococcus sp.]|nr:serine/threonine protein kinase [Ruminococcus sp.]
MMYILDNRYEIEKEAGRGGTSIVYKAYDLQAERAVRAIKEINKDNSAIYELAKKESKLIKELYEQDKSNSFLPNIIHTFGTHDKFYIVQDFLDGESMDKMLENGAMPYDMFIESAKQICSFMEFFHRTGKVHSDMKPENIMVLKPSTTLMDGSRKKSIKLKFIDFGTAIKNESGVTGYTPEYASREQYEQRPNIDKRSDIFNIGATFYHM